MAAGDKYRAVHRRSLEDPEGFWAEQAGAIDWSRRWDKVLDSSKAPFYRWFAGAELNTCYNALDRHVERGRGEQAALIYDSPGHQTQEELHLSRAARRRWRSSPARSPARASARATASSSTCR